MGRPAKLKSEKQSKLIAVRLTPAEHQVIKRAAAALRPKPSLSAYLRARGLMS
jgi:uncharacterized protein (DUF1778 family)